MLKQNFLSLESELMNLSRGVSMSAKSSLKIGLYFLRKVWMLKEWLNPLFVPPKLKRRLSPYQSESINGLGMGVSPHAGVPPSHLSSF
ncbi:MAG: hypothetical protein ACPGJV_05340 [Bacteriovoracaceae bacterium]